MALTFTLGESIAFFIKYLHFPFMDYEVLGVYCAHYLLLFYFQRCILSSEIKPIKQNYGATADP